MLNKEDAEILYEIVSNIRNSQNKVKCIINDKQIDNKFTELVDLLLQKIKE